MKFQELLSKISSILDFSGGKTSVGLSIGSSSIKLVELKKSGKTWKLIHFGIVQLPDEVIVNREIINPIVVSESIKTLTSQMKLKNKNICTSISGTALLIRRMTLEVPRPSELQEQVFWEAEQYLPFDISEVYMDFQVLSRSKEGKTDVLFVAVKKTVLDTYMNCVEDAGLKASIVDVDFFALQNLLEINYPPNPNESVAIVDIGSSAIKIVVIHAGVPVFTKDSTLGGRTLTVEIQKNLNLSFNDAETLKTGGEGGINTPQEISDLIHVMVENVSSEIKKSVDYYNASATGAPIAYVLLTGGSAKLTGLSKSVEERVGLPVQLINPFNAISYDPNVFNQEYLNNIAPIAAVSVGLALRSGAK